MFWFLMDGQERGSSSGLSGSYVDAVNPNSSSLTASSSMIPPAYYPSIVSLILITTHSILIWSKPITNLQKKKKQRIDIETLYSY